MLQNVIFIDRPSTISCSSFNNALHAKRGVLTNITIMCLALFSLGGCADQHQNNANKDDNEFWKTHFSGKAGKAQQAHARKNQRPHKAKGSIDS